MEITSASVCPTSAGQLASVLAENAAAGRRIELGGAFSKRRLGGPAAGADVCVSTAGMRRVLQYEPDDLTISVEAGLSWAELSATVATHRQMVPLDPPFFDAATVGGVVAANTVGPRRRLYGGVRDFVIGMEFATLEGKLVQSGGMVVKNVAGLDMSKLLIGSLGTLAAIATVNFKLVPQPEATRTFIHSHATAAAAIDARDRLLKSVLQPVAVDLLNPLAAARAGAEGWCLAVQCGGSAAVLARYAREVGGTVLEGAPELAFWTAVREFAPNWLRDHPDGGVMRVPGTLDSLGKVAAAFPGPVLARAATGVSYCYAQDARELRPSGTAVIDYSPEHLKAQLPLWPEPGGDFIMMTKVKQLFDPKSLLNPGRMYGRI